MIVQTKEDILGYFRINKEYLKTKYLVEEFGIF